MGAGEAGRPGDDLFRRAPVAILLLDPDLRIVDATDLYLASTLTVRDQIVGRDVFEVFPDDRDREDADGPETLRASLHRVLTTRRTDTMAVQRYDVRRPDSEGGGFEQRFWSVVNTPILDDVGRVTLIYNHVVDVTEFVALRSAVGEADPAPATRAPDRTEFDIVRSGQELQRANAALRESEERFHLLADATNDALWDWDLRTDDLWWSEGFTRLFGYDLQAIPPTIESWIERIHPDDADWVVADVERAIASGARSWSAQYRYRHRDGREVWVIDRGHVLRDEHGVGIRMVGGMTDVTEQIRGRRELQEQARLLDLASDAILVRDLDHTVRYWNEGAARMYGWEAEEVVGRSIRDLLYDDPSVFDEATRRTMRDGTWTGELVQRTRSGDEIVVEVRWTLIRDDAGAPTAVLARNTDVTERRHIERQLRRAQRLESIGTLAGGVAHDLNNVLLPITLSVDLLAREESDPVRLAMLGTIRTSAERGADMIGQMLAYARGVEGERAPVTLVSLLGAVGKFIGDTFPKDIEVEIGDPTGLPAVRGDATQLQQVLLNLCVNARDAMPGGGTLRITADPGGPDEAGRQWVVLTVADTGHGMDEATLARIFDPFFTTKPTGEGTGLGLWTSLGIVRGHGGRLDVWSEPGTGTRVECVLPVDDMSGGADDGRGDEAWPVRDPADSVPVPSGRGEVVLVVDDEEPVRRMACDALRTYGYRTVEASNGAEALAVIAEHEDVVVVVTDMMMPVMDGAASIRRMLALRPDLRIVAASGLADAGGSERADAAGASRTLAKPYSVGDLLGAVAAVLGDPTADGPVPKTI